MAQKAKPVATKYDGLEPKKSEHGYCLVQDTNGKWFAFADHTKNHIVESARKRVFKGIAELEAQPTVIAELHQELFNSTIGKGEAELAPYYVWAKMVNLAVDRTAPAAGTVSKPDSRIYSFTGTPEQVAAIKTPQMKVCAQIVADCCKDKGSVSGEDLKKAIYERASELRTRQDAFRIFQYYRGTLIKLGIIKHN